MVRDGASAPPHHEGRVFHAAKYADRKGLFVSCAFAAAGRMLSATREKSEGVRMSALQPVSGKSDAAGNGTYDVVVVGAGFAGMYMLHRLRGLGLGPGLRAGRRCWRHLVLEPVSRRALR